MELRPLRAADAPLYQPVRLRALREHPEAFGAAEAEEAALTPEQVAQQLGDGLSASVTFGALEGGALLGMLALARFGRAKTRHKALLSGMFVVPERRGQGLGQALLAAAIAGARATAGLEDLTLAVTVGNAAARRLYLDAGFVPYGVEPRYIKLGEMYYDIEWLILRL